MSGTRHNSNVELFAQGLANIASPMVGGLPATGAIARTATNVRAGAKTPVAGIVHALTLGFILLFAAPLAAHVPMAVLAAILLVVAYNMGEWREIPELWKHGWTDRLVWLVTFALTVFADLTVAVEAINFAHKLGLFAEPWSPRVIAEMNDYQFKLVKLQGEFVWHHHENEDELFLVVNGGFRMEFRDRHVELRAGEMIVVPRGVKHRPVAEKEVAVLLFEPASTLNTGNVIDEFTVRNLQKI